MLHLSQKHDFLLSLLKDICPLFMALMLYSQDCTFHWYERLLCGDTGATSAPQALARRAAGREAGTSLAG